MLPVPGMSLDPSAEAQTPPAVDLWSDPFEMERVVNILSDELQNAESARSEHLERVTLWRKMYELIPPERDLAWDGAANFRSPLSQNKVDKIVCLLVAALDQDPFYSVRARTAAAEVARQLLEEYLDLKVDELKIRDHTQLILKEAYVTGTGFSKCVYENSGGKDRHRLEVVPFEDFLVSPITVAKLEDAFLVAHTFYTPLWRLQQMQEDSIKRGGSTGIHPECQLEMLDSVTGNAGRDSPNPVVNSDLGHQSPSVMNRGSKLIPIYECWWQDGGQMWVTWFHKGDQKVLRHEVNPYEHGHSPFTRTCFDPQVNNIYGRSLVQKLETIQIEFDSTTNMRLDANSLSVGGLFIIQSGTATAKWFEDGNQIRPGATIQVDDIMKPGIMQLRFEGANVTTLQDQQLLFQFADKTAIPDTSLSQPLTNRNPTATEVNRDEAVVTSLLKSWLHNIHNGLLDLGNIIRTNLYQFEVKPNGGAMFSSADTEQVIKPDQMFMDDIELQVTGRETQTMQAEEIAKATLVAQVILPIIHPPNLPPGSPPVPISDPRVYSILKHFLSAHGVKGWKEFLGPQPPSFEQMAQAAEMATRIAQLDKQGGANALVQTQNQPSTVNSGTPTA
jgi:hypothetical protein